MKVQVLTLDKLLKYVNYSIIDLVKIDSEGLGVKILDGQEQAFSQIKRIIIETETITGKTISKILLDNGYTIRYLDGNDEQGGNLLAEKNIL